MANNPVLRLRNVLFSALTVIEEHVHDEGEMCYGCFVEDRIKKAIAETRHDAAVELAAIDRRTDRDQLVDWLRDAHGVHQDCNVCRWLVAERRGKAPDERDPAQEASNGQ